jgi:hypothetical protein
VSDITFEVEKTENNSTEDGNNAGRRKLAIIPKIFFAKFRISFNCGTSF